MSKTAALCAIACTYLAFAPVAEAAVAQVKTARDGFVDVAGTVGPDGTVLEVHVVRSEPPGKYDATALRSVRSWRFRAKLVDGVAVERPFEQRIVFSQGFTQEPRIPDQPLPEPASTTTELIPITRTAPAWPTYALQNRLSGWVRVRGVVDAEGKVESAYAASAYPRGLFERSAVGAVRAWRFKPSTIDGVPKRREFEQVINFMMEGSRNSDQFIDLIEHHQADAEALYAQVRGFCADRYAHADDAPNEALKVTNEYSRPPEKLDERSELAMFELQQLSSCLFSTWEQLRDPDAYFVAAQMVALMEAATLGKKSVGSAEALRAVGAWKRDLGGASPPSAEQTIQVSSWLFVRFTDAYYELVHAQAKLLPGARPTTPLAIEALDKANAAYALGHPRESRSILVKALKTLERPVDRELVLLALARFEVGLDEQEDALGRLDEVLAMSELPWNIQQAARIARATLCGRRGDVGCFRSTVDDLNRELGVEGRFTF